MPSRVSLFALAVTAAGAAAALMTACAHARSAREPYADAACGARPQSRVLAEDAGERRVRRPPPDATGPGLPFVVKVDCQSVGSTDLFLAYEELPLGGRIRPHHHPHMDEILIVRGGSGVVMLGSAETAVAAGATIYIAPNTVVGVRNTGSVPLRIAFIFPHSGYGTYLREWSVAEGEPVRPLTESENATRLHQARWLQMFEP